LSACNRQAIPRSALMLRLCILLQIWDVREGHLLYTLHGHEGAVSAPKHTRPIARARTHSRSTPQTDTPYVGIQHLCAAQRCGDCACTAHTPRMANLRRRWALPSLRSATTSHRAAPISKCARVYLARGQQQPAARLAACTHGDQAAWSCVAMPMNRDKMGGCVRLF
jgi:hypothetical protein